ncbi:hypothetical protein PCASD_13230 [Puccinia coronata f. sp. avenae]|uniref:Uncharacterized protein n=1 Tax=Puccinia coronata f. sp. avenae TaxID=200324 RepID=A0A2N5UGB2_9BASI|nr:hypothetical protein PCASD_13230 [Puccinia coronata f. sp. avenae]
MVGDYLTENHWSDCGRRSLLKSVLYASWLRQKFLNALKKRDTAKHNLKKLFESENPHAEGNVKYSTQFLRAQWVKQAECESQRAEDNELRMKQLAEFFRNEEVLKKANCVDDWDWVLTLFETHEAKQQELAKSIGRNYTKLLSATADEEGKLALLWEAMSELFLQAVELQGERYPIMGSQTVGTKIQQQILKAIKRRKNPVEKAIKNFNTRRSEDPWAIDPLVRHGIQAVLLLDRVQEEVQLLTHNLDRAMSWAHELCMDLERALSQLDTWMASPDTLDLSNPRNRITMASIALPVPSKLQIWMCDIDWLWERTRNQHTKSEHPWFECMADLREQHHEDALRSIDNALELLDFNSNPPDEVEGVRENANIDDEHDSDSG